MKTPTEKVAYFDTIRAFAIVAVVITHVVMGVQHRVAPSDLLSWWTLNIYTVAARSCVPLFIMISGALLLDPRKTESIATFFRKRAFRVLVPFVLWSTIYLLLRKYVHHEKMSLANFFTNLFSGPTYLHLWFVYILIGLYLVTPFLRALVRRLELSALRYLLIAWFFLFAFFPFFAQIFQLQTAFGLFTFLGYVGYFVLGFYLHSQKTHFDARKSLLAVCVITLATCWLNAWSPEKRDEWNGFLSPNIVLMSACVFCLFTSWWIDLSREALINRCVKILSDYSFGIYFVHIIILEGLASGKLLFTLNGLSFHPLLGIPFTTLLTLLISLVLLWTMRKIAVVRLLAP